VIKADPHSQGSIGLMTIYNRMVTKIIKMGKIMLFAQKMMRTLYWPDIIMKIESIDKIVL